MDVAPLLQVQLGPDDLADYCRDLSALVTMQEIRLEDHTGLRRCRLDEVFAAIEAGTAHRAMLRYAYLDDTWIDTLKIDTEGVHLVRMAIEPAEDGA